MENIGKKDRFDHFEKPQPGCIESKTDRQRGDHRKDRDKEIQMYRNSQKELRFPFQDHLNSRRQIYVLCGQKCQMGYFKEERYTRLTGRQ